MKIITIGRSSENKIRINDDKVSRIHCQIILDDNGIFKIIDMNSKNGTFVNGRICKGEVKLNSSDIVRIGNTTIPWKQYFATDSGETTTGSPSYSGHSLSCIKIGRDASNDIHIPDNLVSRFHCQLIQDVNGVKIKDTNSKNGTFVNGNLINGSRSLYSGDIVKIGNTMLQWEQYIKPMSATDLPPGIDVDSDDSDEKNQKSGLGMIALLISICGTALLIYVAILIMKFGIFAWIGEASTYAFVSFGLHIIAVILASIADYNDYKDSDQANIAECLSGTCIFIMIGYYLYLRFGNGIQSLNPLRNILK